MTIDMEIHAEVEKIPDKLLVSLTQAMREAVRVLDEETNRRVEMRKGILEKLFGGILGKRKKKPKAIKYEPMPNDLEKYIADFMTANYEEIKKCENLNPNKPFHIAVATNKQGELIGMKVIQENEKGEPEVIREYLTDEGNKGSEWKKTKKHK